MSNRDIDSSSENVLSDWARTAEEDLGLVGDIVRVDEARSLLPYSSGTCRKLHISTRSSARAAVRSSARVLARLITSISSSAALIFTPRRLLLPSSSACLLA